MCFPVWLCEWKVRETRPPHSVIVLWDRRGDFKAGGNPYLCGLSRAELEGRIWGWRVKVVAVAVGGNVSEEAGKKILRQNECCATGKRGLF